MLYSFDRVHSPITSEHLAAWRAFAAANPARKNDVFAKIGASSTASTSFMHCFAGGNVDWGAHAALAPTRDLFLAGDAGGTNPFQRTSLCATVGWSAFQAIAGTPSPLERELAAAKARFAGVHYGTNDIGYDDIDGFASDMLFIVDTALREGALPWLGTILPRLDSASANAKVPSYNAVIRAVAQWRAVPLLDFYLAASALPGFGMASDGLHPKAYSGGACIFTPAGLAFGFNVRNLITLELLQRLTAALDGSFTAEAPARRILGAGTDADPFVIDQLPFVDGGDTRTATSRAHDGYPGCDQGQDESGAEIVYAFSLAAETKVRINVHSRDDADLDVHLLDGNGCLQRHHRSFVRTLPPGDYRIIFDTFVSNGKEKAGEALFSVLIEP